MENITWIEPTLAASPSNSEHKTAVLSESDIHSWREYGYCLVNGIYPDDVLHRVVNDCKSVFPPPLSEEANKITYYGGFVNFPSTYESVNELPLHPRMMQAVRQLFGFKDLHDVRLTQTEVWPKYGRTDSRHETDADDNNDQRMHCDYPSHTLTHPSPWYEPEVVSIILYLSDVDDCQGATAVVPRTGKDDPAYTYPQSQMPGMEGIDFVNNRKLAEEHLQKVAPAVAEYRAEHLYSREQKVRYRFGTVLFYRQDTWHRGTPLKPGSLRIVVNMTYRKAIAEWISTMHIGWSWGMLRRGLPIERLLANATPEQRSLLGFPKPGHAYWTEEKIAAVTARYGKLGFNPKPYKDAMKK